MAGGAMWEDLKGWGAPGELKLFPLEQLDEAKAWVWQGNHACPGVRASALSPDFT
jgi:hypothetical protein